MRAWIRCCVRRGRRAERYPSACRRSPGTRSISIRTPIRGGNRSSITATGSSLRSSLASRNIFTSGLGIDRHPADLDRRLRPDVKIFLEARLERSDEPVAVIEDYFRSEEHTSELQSRVDLVCRLLLEKKKKARYQHEPEPTT